MNILYQEATSMEIHPSVFTLIIIIAFIVLIPFAMMLAEDYLILSVILTVGAIVGVIIGSKFSCITTPPETRYWVESDTVSKEDWDKYELIEQKGRIYILREIEQAE